MQLLTCPLHLWVRLAARECAPQGKPPWFAEEEYEKEEEGMKLSMSIEYEKEEKCDTDHLWAHWKWVMTMSALKMSNDYEKEEKRWHDSQMIVKMSMEMIMRRRKKMTQLTYVAVLCSPLPNPRALCKKYLFRAHYKYFKKWNI